MRQQEDVEVQQIMQAALGSAASGDSQFTTNEETSPRLGVDHKGVQWRATWEPGEASTRGPQGGPTR